MTTSVLEQENVVARFMVRQFSKLTVLSKVEGQARHPVFDSEVAQTRGEPVVRVAHHPE